ncbi:MAG TPA: hypothetical protein VF399_12405 [bacterium]
MRGRKYLYAIFAMLVMAGIGSAAVLPMVGVDIPVRSKYVWRGAVFNTDPVLWPDAWINWFGFTFCAWGSMDLTDVKEKQLSLTDLALFLDYTRPVGPVTPTVGFALYNYPGSAYGDAFPTTGEVYAKVSGSLGVLQAALNLNYDVMEAKGLYVSPSITKVLPLGPVALSLTLSGGFADGNHNVYYYGLDKTCFTDLTAVLKLTFTPSGPLAKWLMISADIDYAMLIDSELADLVETYGDSKNIYGGGGIGIYYLFGGE